MNYKESRKPAKPPKGAQGREKMKQMLAEAEFHFLINSMLIQAELILSLPRSEKTETTE